MPRVYPLRTQLNTGSPTDGEDCGPVTIINAIKWASNNEIRIGQSDVKEWVRKIRDWAGRPRGGFYLERDCYRVYNHPEFKKEFTKRGLKPPTARYHRRMTWDTFARHLKAGDFCQLPVDYGYLLDGNAPVGSYAFNGDHYVALLHAPRMSDKRHRFIVWDGDPLFDGRRADIPDGWQQTRLYNFKIAAGHWGLPTAGFGYCYAITLKKGV